MYRQGDILIIPRNPYHTTTSYGGTVVAEGELTGHRHQIIGGFVDRVSEPFSMLVVEAEIGRLVHEEHNTIELPRGYYEIVRQREFDGLNDRQVWD